MPNTDEIATILRLMIKHEGEQVDRRLSWLGTFQGLLFAAMGFIWDKDRSIVIMLAFLGIAIALLVFFGQIGSGLAFKRIHQYWKEHRPANYKGPDIWGFFLRKHH